jgi:hypothetical protein
MRSLAFFVALAVVGTIVSAVAAEVTLNPVADSPIFGRSGYTTRNYGSQSYGFWGYWYGGQRTLVRYDCTSVTGAVTSAQLIVRFMQNNYGTGKMWSCKVNAAWVESTVTWANQPTHDSSTSGRLLDINWVSGLGPHTMNCTSAAVTIIQGWVNTPATNYGMILKKDPELGTVPRCYPYMRESAYPGVQLKVVYTVGVEPQSLGTKALFK